MSSCPQKTQSCGFLVKHSLVYRNFTPKLCLWLLIFERVEIYFWVHDQSHKGRVGRKPASYLRTVHWELEKQMVSPTRQRENTKGGLINSMGRHSGRWLEPRDLRPAYIVCWECRGKKKQQNTKRRRRKWKKEAKENDFCRYSFLPKLAQVGQQRQNSTLVSWRWACQPTTGWLTLLKHL